MEIPGRQRLKRKTNTTPAPEAIPVTRSAAIPVLNSVLAAPVTRTIRDIPTELRLGTDDGMPTDCVASFDNLRVVPKAYLVDQICTLQSPRLAEACAAVQAAIDC